MGVPGGPRLRAQLEAPTIDLAESAVVEVQVERIWLHRPVLAISYGVPTGELRYQVDNQPTVVTTDTRLKFEGLARGEHTIRVTLLGADERPLGPPAVVQLHVR